ncbi:MAG: hypothetical protein HFG62_15825 [Lachnospiraceae bacterium]|jgi:YbbR domain-containing protein|nr:hypothetical protein [Lachnospiraceae bacterium]MCI8960569.1 hypothetical protein [Lachnospiraceae bacterium]
MKERLINNLGLKILSIFLAFVIWFGVVNVSNPEVNRTKEVSLEIVNGHVLTSARKAYEISGKDTVTVTYDVRTRDAYKVRSSDFRAYVDLAQLYSVTGSVPVQVEVLNNRDILANVSARPGVVHVDTEDLQTKSFDLNMNVTGKAQDGYAPDGISLNPPYVTLEGPVSKVGQVSAAGVEISIDGLAEDQSGVVTPVFYDANGNSLKLSDQVRVNTPEIEYHLTINKVKELPLEFEVSGTVAPGYQYVGAECSRRTVSVIGLKSNLAGLSRITIPAQELTVEGATQDRVVSLDLHRFLPEGIRMAESESSSIEVRLVVERLETRTLTITERDVKLEGARDGYAYYLKPWRGEIVVQGLKEDLESLTPSDLQITVDLSGMEPGINESSLIFGENRFYTVLSHTNFEIEVTQRTGVLEAPQGTEGEETGEETSAESEEETSASGSAAVMEAGGPAMATTAGGPAVQTSSGDTHPEESSQDGGQP